MKTSIKILSIILITLLISCQQEVKRKVYKTTDGKGYCYQDDNTLLWYLLIYNNSTHSYDVTPTSTTPSYDIATSQSMSVDSNSMSADMSESTGQDVGGSDVSNESSGDGMSESSGSDSGGSDSSGGDSGGSDGGGGGE